MKIISRVRGLGEKLLPGEAGPVPAAPAMKLCPYCRLEIPLGAARCGHCTSDLSSMDIGSDAAAAVAMASLGQPGLKLVSASRDGQAYSVRIETKERAVRQLTVDAATGEILP